MSCLVYACIIVKKLCVCQCDIGGSESQVCVSWLHSMRAGVGEKSVRGRRGERVICSSSG